MLRMTTLRAVDDDPTLKATKTALDAALAQCAPLEAEELAHHRALRD